MTDIEKLRAETERAIVRSNEYGMNATAQHLRALQSALDSQAAFIAEQVKQLEAARRRVDEVEAQIVGMCAESSALADLASIVHYPDHWDTAAYPKPRDAIREALFAVGCSECRTAPATPAGGEAVGAKK